MVLPAFAVEAKVVHVLATGLPESIAMLSNLCKLCVVYLL